MSWHYSGLSGEKRQAKKPCMEMAEEKYDIVNNFCYLGDTLSMDEGVDAAGSASVRNSVCWQGTSRTKHHL